MINVLDSSSDYLAFMGAELSAIDFLTLTLTVVEVWSGMHIQ